jgi:hypothetical protein
MQRIQPHGNKLINNRVPGSNNGRMDRWIPHTMSDVEEMEKISKYQDEVQQSRANTRMLSRHLKRHSSFPAVEFGSPRDLPFFATIESETSF